MSSTIISKPAHERYIKMRRIAIEDYPKVPGMGKHQEFWSTTIQEYRISEADFASFTFSPAFQMVYGAPVIYYSHWCQLWQPSFRNYLIPRYKTWFGAFIDSFNVVNFYLALDDACSYEGRATFGPVPKRFEAEALLAQFLFGKFVEIQPEQIRTLVTAYRNEQKTREMLQYKMKKVLSACVSQDVERYWQQKAINYNLDPKDVQRINEEQWEPLSQQGDSMDTFPSDDEMSDNGEIEDEMSDEDEISDEEIDEEIGAVTEGLKAMDVADGTDL